MEDKKCLCEGLVCSASFEETGINQNTAIIGGTGTGKSTTINASLAHTYNSSQVIPVAKEKTIHTFFNEFKERGYKVDTINFARPERSTAGIELLDMVKTDIDATNLASSFVRDERRGKGSSDPFWENSAVSLLAALIMLVIMNAKVGKTRPRFYQVIDLYRKFEFKKDPRSDGDGITTTLDAYFEKSNDIEPCNQAVKLWNTFRTQPPRTAACIYSQMASSVDKIFCDSVYEFLKRDDSYDFTKLGDEKRILFIVTSPFNSGINELINVVYSQMFKGLFEHAIECENEQLNVPVHIVCDDFACGAKIENFASYISIFRAAGISVTILLQSESQLHAMYGEAEATIILDNIDTYIFTGSLSPNTITRMSEIANLPRERVSQLPLEHVIVIRRGSKPVIARRYQTFDDPLYKEIVLKNRNRNEEDMKHE